ncbi:hypothetical protein Taro_050668 [Colocasia esculenta]|uniref:Ubiquitin-like protease family profile domain-containing protein n=1 Tax=Colocasia esculenta TaxID=4460 RepID=A0A843XE06_COLES|nr:hypothetical protein [Colocasia esculenta]
MADVSKPPGARHAADMQTKTTLQRQPERDTHDRRVQNVTSSLVAFTNGPNCWPTKLENLQEADKKRKEEEEEHKRKQAEEDQKKKREEEEQKKKEAEEEQKKRKEEEEHKRKKVEEEQKRKRKRRGRRRRKRRRGRRQRRRGRRRRRRRRGRGVIFLHPHCPNELQQGREKGGNRRYPEDYRYYKAPKVNVSTFEPIFLSSHESTCTLPTGKKEGRRDYVIREKMYTFLTCSDLMFGGTLEGYDNFLTFKDIWELLFGGQSESVIIDCYVNTYLFLPRQENPNIFKTFGYLGATLKGYVQSCKDDKSKQQHLDYSFKRLDCAPTELGLLFSPMHVGTNHWSLLVINIKEKKFHVYDSLRNKDRPDIPQYYT